MEAPSRPKTSARSIVSSEIEAFPSPFQVVTIRCSFKMLCVAQISAHSPRACLIYPNTGSTIALRRA